MHRVTASKVKVAIIGSDRIGTDLSIKIMRMSQTLEIAAFVGIDAASDGLRWAADMGVPTTDERIEGLTHLAVWPDIAIAFRCHQRVGTSRKQ